MAVKRKKEQTISTWLVVAVLATCAFGGYLYLPSQRTILERQVKDNQVLQAIETLGKISQWQKKRDPVFYLVTELKLREKQLEGFKNNALDDLLVRAYAGAVQFDFPPELMELVLRFTKNHPRAERALALIKPWLPKIPSKTQEVIVGELTKAFLADGNTSVAAQLYEEFYLRVPANENRLAEYIRLWRLAGRADKALAMADPFMKEVKPETVPRVARLHIDLLREAGEGGRAFEATHKLFLGSGEKARADLYDLLVTTAQQVNRVGEIMAEVEEKALQTPDEVDPWVSFRELAVAAGKLPQSVRAAKEVVRIRPESDDWFRYGQLLEWTSRGAEAFDAFVPAAKLKNGKAIDRLLVIAPQLGRDFELAEVLTSMPEVVKERAMEQTLAHLTERSGLFDDADRWYAAAVARNGNDLQVLRDYGRFLMGLYEYDRAVDIFLLGVKLAPADATLVSGLSEAYYRIGEYEKAHAVLEEAVDKSPDDQLLTQLVNLSDSLQRLDTLIFSLQRRINSQEGSAADIRRLAFAYLQTGRNAELLQILRLGLAKYPKDPDLRFQLANFHAGRKDYLEAIKVLAGSELLENNINAIQLYTSMLAQSQQFQEAEAFFTSSVPDSAKQTVVFLDLQASIAEGLGRPLEAEAIYARLAQMEPKNVLYNMNHARLLTVNGKLKEAEVILARYQENPAPPVMKLMAQVLATRGNYKEAEKWQQRYLATRPSDLPQAFGFLGDVRLSRGDKVNAKRAYQRGLDAMLQLAAAQNAPRRN